MLVYHMIKNIINNRKYIFAISVNDEELAARCRDLFILNHLDDYHYKLNFIWTEKEIIEWTRKIKVFNKTSKHRGISYNKKSNRWILCLYKNKKKVIHKIYKTEDLAIRKKDLYIIENNLQNNNKYKLVFEWNEQDIKYWSNLLK